MKVRVLVHLKPGVLDPAGKAVSHGLHQLGFPEVEGVRLGRSIELVVADGTPRQRIEEMCKKLLANPVIEDFRVEMP